MSDLSEDFNHYTVVAEVKERLFVSKQVVQKCEIVSYELNKLNYVEVMMLYQFELQRLHSTGWIEKKILNCE